jgi:serine/threonine protein kinase
MAEDFIGKLIDRKYRIQGELGRGAMGVVYRAEQLDAAGRARRVVAVKTLKPEFSADPDFARRFLREVGVTMQLRSPHVLTVYDSGRDERGQLYYVMEFMPQTLKVIMDAQGALPVARAVAIGSQLCDALAEAQSLPEPVVHRDLKPANIFIEQRRGQESVKLGDFGIAKILGEHTVVLTRAGYSSPGTPRYMAPEQWAGHGVDGRTDLYSLERFALEWAQEWG